MANKIRKEIKYNLDPYDILVSCSENQDMTGWINWRKHNPKTQIGLEGANLQGTDLHMADLHMVNLKKADLQEAKLQMANLQEANLQEANLQKAKLQEAKLQETNLQEANLQEADLKGADLQGADLKGADLQGADLKGADLQGADLQGAELQGAELQGANLQMANFQGANLQEANIQEAELLWANLQGAELIEAKLQKANLQMANLQMAELQGAELQGANLQDAKLQDAKLQEAKLQGAKLQRTKLQGAKLQGAKLQGAMLNFAYADSMTTIENCDFDKKTNFTGVGLDGITIDPGLKAAFKNNIRRIKWEEWIENERTQGKRFVAFCVKWFWLLSNYGSSTKRIIKAFFIISAIFCFIYWFFAVFPNTESSIIADLRQVENGPAFGWMHTLARSFYFSIVTMTTLGFGDMHAVKSGGWQGYLGYFFLSLQVILGYVLLGALVTRMGILFMSEAPEPKTQEVPARRWFKSVRDKNKEL
ncbi:MAG: hypothetical protein GY874_14570 [Desulfobacteraceae bacterium]|nr:hypothetical protein [Desulfobacteraceae bacterium]